jgi:hypothetical protein
MGRQTKKAPQAARQDSAEHYLFDEQDLPPMQHDNVVLGRRGKDLYTGARLLVDEKKCQHLVELLMEGRGLKRIARALHTSKWSVVKARDALVTSGRIVPWKRRVVGIFEEIIELSLVNYLAELEADRVPIASLPVAVGIMADKRALTLRETACVGAGGLIAVNSAAVSVEAWQAWLANNSGTKESESRPPVVAAGCSAGDAT